MKDFSLDADDFVADLGRMSGSLKSYASELDRDRRERNKAEEQLSRDLHKRAQTTGEAFSALAGSATSAKHYFLGVLGKAGLVGAAFAKLVNVGNDLTDTYRDMVNVGQTFGGSLLDMSLAAANAGMPLSDFAKAVKRSSNVVATMGAKDFGNFRKSMNRAMMQNGMFAMTTDQTTEFMGQYLETNRRSHVLEKMNQQQQKEGMLSLMTTTTRLSAATGVARDQMVELANSAMQSSMAMARIASMNSASAIKANKQLQESVTIMASQAGEAGQFLTGALAETFGTNGLSEFTTQGQTLINAGLGNVAAQFNNLANNLSPENTIKTMEYFRTEVEKNIPSLQALAMGGNESAKEMLRVYSQMKKMSVSDLRRRAEEQDGLTKLFTSFSTAWDLVSGSFRTGFLKGFKPLFDSVGDFTKSDGFKRVQSIMGAFGEGLGKLIAQFFDSKTLKKVGDWTERFASWILGINWEGVIGGFVGFMAKIPWADVGVAVLSLIAVMKTAAWFMGLFGGFGPVLMGVMLPLKMIIGPVRLLGGLFGGIVRAGAGLLRFLPLFGEGLAAVAARLGMGAMGAAAGGAGGLGAGALGLAAGVGRFAMKAVPIVGGALGLYDGATRVNQESGVQKGIGYGESALSGAALGATIGSIVPGLGTAIGAGIGGAVGLAVAGISDLIASDKKDESQKSIQSSQSSLENAQNSANGSPNGPDPVIARLDRLIKTNEDANDLMVATAVSQRQIMDDQRAILKKIAQRS